MLESFHRQPGLFEFPSLEIADPVHDGRNQPACSFFFWLIREDSDRLFHPAYFGFLDDSDFRLCGSSVLFAFLVSHNFSIRKFVVILPRQFLLWKPIIAPHINGLF